MNHELTDAQCDAFRRYTGDFRAMVRAIFEAGAQAQAALEAGQWVPIRLSDAPRGVQEIYPEERAYQFIAPRGDGSAQGNQAWLITLPGLPDAPEPERTPGAAP